MAANRFAGRDDPRVFYPEQNLSKYDFMRKAVPYLLRNGNIYLTNQVGSINIIYSLRTGNGALLLARVKKKAKGNPAARILGKTSDVVIAVRTAFCEEYGDRFSTVFKIIMGSTVSRLPTLRQTQNEAKSFLYLPIHLFGSNRRTNGITAVQALCSQKFSHLRMI